MKKTTATCIWVTDTKYLILDWVGGHYYNVSCWHSHRCGPDNLEEQCYLSKSLIWDLLNSPVDSSLLSGAQQWLKYAIVDGIDPMEAKERLYEGGVL